MNRTNAGNGIKLFQGTISHQRLRPVKHTFRYSLFLVWLDVERPELVDAASRFWSSNKFNLVRYQRQNYLPGPNSLIAQTKLVINSQTGKTFNGKVYLLSSLSYWGYCYNPVSFYFCYDERGTLTFILSEIHNTPWGERFTYVHDVSESSHAHHSSRSPNDTSDSVRFEFDKAFHVSPFMPMGLQYDWSFKVHEDRVLISMNLQQDKQAVFNATLNLSGEPLTGRTANAIPFRYALMSVKVSIAIYWNAFRLWIKRVPFYPHPNK